MFISPSKEDVCGCRGCCIDITIENGQNVCWIVAITSEYSGLFKILISWDTWVPQRLNANLLPGV